METADRAPRLTAGRLRVVVATPLDDDLCERIVRVEPRIDLVHDSTLLPTLRYASDHADDPGFRRTAAQHERFDTMVNSAEVLFGIPDLDPRALGRNIRSNPHLRWVQTMAAGGGAQVQAAELSDAELARIMFTTAAGVHGKPLAEFALFGLLAGAKMLPRLRADQQAHTWADRWQMKQLGEQTILVLGSGGLGRQVVRVLGALGVHVIVTSRRGHAVDGAAEIVHPARLAEVLPRVDGLVVTLPGTDATTGLVGADLFSRIKPGATLVNIGRGTVVDEDALIAALRNGTIGFAALDVFAVEPLAASSALWELPNVLVSPHTAALNGSELSLIADLFADNATRLLDGAPLVNVVDTVDFY